MLAGEVLTLVVAVKGLLKNPEFSFLQIISLTQTDGPVCGYTFDES